ncbi:thiol transferase Tc52 [Trypanosoma theileri]|uniref:Thiol transferase Tc52 n=1 Tax=Trypanosoma theileri TaxID=67003 RepID=A0A1X0P247_9TRYP|nr:thiol transferase Tc52 [Trypanosoma theileri]ORC90470.1 thiol transferase Tc52 [Trypanosoma theileri]
MTKALKLFKNAICPYSQRAMIMAKEKQLTVEEVDIPLGDDKPKWYKDINPRETVPTLQVDGKRFVYESDLIMRYLAGITADKNNLLGSTPYERHRVEFFMSQVSDLIGAYFTLSEDPFNEAKRKAVDDNTEYIEAIVAEQQNEGPYFLDKTFSIADITVLPFFIRFHPVLSYYAGYDIFTKAPRMKRMFFESIKRPSVKETTLNPEDYIVAFKTHVPSSHLTWPLAPNHVLFVNMMCPFADRPRLACAVKNIDFPIVEIDLSKKPKWYSWINYRETVPTLLTPQGSYVHESQPIVHYIDEQFPEKGPQLLPKDADGSYYVRFAESNASYFHSAMYGLMKNPQDKGAKEDIEWVGSELEKQLKEQHFGAGPFFGGNKMNAADVYVLPMLVRMKACAPELTGGYDFFAKHKLLEALVDAGLASEAGKKVFLPLQEYHNLYKAKFGTSS